MDYFKIISISFFTLLLFTSCGGEKKSSAKFSIDISALSGAGSNASGGVMLVGHKLDDSAVFSRSFKSNDSDPVLELDNGKWEFYLSYWVGVAPLTGSAFCAYSGPYELNGSQINISFQTTAAKCHAPLPDGTSVSEDFDTTTGSWPLVTIKSCLGDPEFCTLQGNTKSFKIRAFNENRNISIPGLNGLTSECNNYSAHPAETQIRVPSGNSADDGTILQIEFQLFTTDDCSGQFVSYNFKDGLKTDFSQSDYSSFYSFSDPNMTISLIHNYATPVAVIDQRLAQFGTGADGDATIATTYASVRNMPSETSFEVASGGTSGLNAGDEIMWYVVSDTSAYCGAAFKPGFYGFSRIKAIAGNVISFFSSHIPGMISSDLVNSANLDPALNYCVIQLSKVINYNNLTLNSSGIVSSTPYDSSSGKGGIVAFRVKGTLEMQDDSYIKAYKAGFQTVSPDVNYGADCIGIKPCLKFGNGGTPTLIPKTGMVQISGTTLTGSGTMFMSELSGSDIIQVNGNIYTISTIADNTNATLVSPGVNVGTASPFFKQDIITNGGGIVYIAARNIKFSNSAGSAYIAADTNIQDASGGSVKVISEKIESTTYDLNSAGNDFIRANTKNTGSGQPGETILKYCFAAGDTSKIPGYAVLNSGSSYDSSLMVEPNSLLCP